MPARGRFAPSPTGDLHLGGARTALCAWLAARSSGGSFVLRMEDLDGPRVVPGAASRILEDLRRLGLDWDEGPDIGGPGVGHGPDFYVQSRAGARYQAAVDELRALGLAYPCWCSRAEIARAASAPHAGEEGPRYPGTCRDPDPAHAQEMTRAGRQPAIRFRVPPDAVEVIDRICGTRRFEPAQAVGDFVIRRSDGLFAYQLAVALDDSSMAIDEVVRGDDLLSSTARQLLILRALGLREPTSFAHVPLVLGPDGQRLAKRHGDGRGSVRALLDGGLSPERLIGALAATLLDGGGAASDEARRWQRGVRPIDLVPRFSFASVRRTPSIIDPAAFAAC